MSGSVSSPVSTPKWRHSAMGVATALLIAIVVAGLADAVIALLARATGASADFAPLHPSSYLPLTAIGIVLGAIGWGVVRRVATNPAKLMRWLVPAAVIVSFVPDLAMLSRPGGGPLAVAALMLMHVAVATAGVLAYSRVLPLRAG